MAARLTEAERLRRHRLIFERALRDNVDLAEAEKRIALDQVAETRRQLDALRSARGAAPSGQQQPNFYWQKGDLA